jgi:predicted transcriptional regulator
MSKNKDSEDHTERSEGNSKQNEENLVKKTCQELGITQKQLAEIVGLSDRTLSKYATSEHIPKNIINHINLLLENRKQKEAFFHLKDSIKTIQKYIE